MHIFEAFLLKKKAATMMSRCRFFFFETKKRE